MEFYGRKTSNGYIFHSSQHAFNLRSLFARNNYAIVKIYFYGGKKSTQYIENCLPAFYIRSLYALNNLNGRENPS